MLKNNHASHFNTPYTFCNITLSLSILYYDLLVFEEMWFEWVAGFVCVSAVEIIKFVTICNRLSFKLFLLFQ